MCGSSGGHRDCKSGSKKSASDAILFLHYDKQDVLYWAWAKRKTRTHRRSAILGARREQRICLSRKSPRSPARAGRQGRRTSRLQSAVRSQRKPLPPANANEHNKERGNTDAESQAKRTNCPHRGPLVCALLATAQFRRNYRAETSDAPVRCGHNTRQESASGDQAGS